MNKVLHKCGVTAFIILFSLSLTSKGQNLQEIFRINESLVESLQELNVGEDEYESILNELEALTKDPIDLNSCSRADLEKLPFLTGFQINSFLEYRSQTGKLLSIYELEAIQGFSDDVIHQILPFVTVIQKQPSALSDGRYARHELALRLQRTLKKTRGYLQENPSGGMKYPGSPLLINVHYGLTLNNGIKAGVTLEKDPGEEFFKGSNKTFDYSSAHIAWNNKTGVVKTIVLGDYRLAFGQGLTLWHGAAPGKSSLPLSVVKRQDAIKLYNSNDENNFFRGTAITTAFGNFTLTAFVSSKNRDANITDTVDSGRIYFSSFQESGYHRTESEITDEKSVLESSWGGNLVYRNNIMKIGATFVSYHLNKYMEAGDELRDIYEFTGNRLTNIGIDYSLVFKKVQFFGEVSGGNGHAATLNGMLLNTGKYASLALLYRYYDPGYFSMHSAAFSEGSTDYNEEALYAGIVVHPVKYFKISAYADFYSFPWLRYRQSKPASGNDILIQADYNPKKILEMYFRFKYEEDPEDYMPDSSLIPDITHIDRSGLRYHIRYDLSKQLTMQNRFDLSMSGASKGVMIYHDISYAAHKLPVSIDYRIAWFHTDDYDSRIYAYEQDVVSGFSFSPLYDKGLRSYFMITGKITRSLSVSLRYSTTFYFNKDLIGSGYDELQSKSKNDLKFRIVYKF